MIPAGALENSLPRNILGIKQPRLGKPKSRSGCLSCKKKHARCDEAKPTCSRCLKANTTCKYSNKQKIRPVIRQRDLLPRYPSAQIISQPRASSFDVGELRYFEMFRYQMAHDFAYTPCTLFWNRIIPREAMQDECIRSSVLSIGALVLSLQRFGPKFPAAFPGKFSDPAHQAAIRYHSKAVSTLQVRMKESFDTISRRTVLINMFLLFLFELLHGNTKAADRMLTSSVELLKQKKDHLFEEVNSPFVIRHRPLYMAALDDDGMQQAEGVLPRLQIFFSLNSPFFPLQKGCWSRLPSEPVPSPVPSPATEFTEFVYTFSNFILKAIVFSVKATEQIRSPEGAADMSCLRRHQATFLSRLHDWQGATSQRIKQETYFLIARTLNILQMGQKVLSILLSCCLDNTELDYDSFEETFKDILTMAHTLTRGSKPITRIETCLDLYILPCLGFLAQKCRNLEIRNGALALYEKMTAGMGGWEAKVILFARRQLVYLEESGRNKDGDIPASARYIWESAAWDETQSSLKIVMSKVLRGASGDRDEVITEMPFEDLQW
ncbi:hypothetical protein FBEOM_8112 [Fusarium beomiforme]|uniref:Zn(2)-C6 fungal-type domain-containing protein n=1 Tax=Fusarium beomiforme TaxID=44412 RepID=A0A9P5AG05_9HYPO|nr:hypothetical protein FBEOM_8112 [Fusarium beomiforme]